MSNNHTTQSKKPNKSVNNWTLLLIGLSAGVIAAVFPRLAPLISQPDSSVTISFFTFQFVVGASIFSVMIGISMIWMYNGTNEHTKNLFMTALALPAVISGGISMTQISGEASDKIGNLNKINIELQDKLEKQNNIETEILSLGEIKEVSSFLPLSFIGISTAYAQENQSALQEPVDENAGISIKTSSLKKDYLVLLKSAATENEILAEMDQLKSTIPDLTTIKAGNKFYLIKNIKYNRSEALLKVLELESKLHFKPKLIQIKP